MTHKVKIIVKMCILLLNAENLDTMLKTIWVYYEFDRKQPRRKQHI